MQDQKKLHTSKPTQRSSNPSIVAQEVLDGFGPGNLQRLLRLAKEKQCTILTLVGIEYLITLIHWSKWFAIT
jgi:hypothetical protein